MFRIDSKIHLRITDGIEDLLFRSPDLFCHYRMKGGGVPFDLDLIPTCGAIPNVFPYLLQTCNPVSLHCPLHEGANKGVVFKVRLCVC